MPSAFLIVSRILRPLRCTELAEASLSKGGWRRFYVSFVPCIAELPPERSRRTASDNILIITDYANSIMLSA